MMPCISPQHREQHRRLHIWNPKALEITLRLKSITLHIKTNLIEV